MDKNRFQNVAPEGYVHRKGGRGRVEEDDFVSNSALQIFLSRVSYTFGI